MYIEKENPEFSWSTSRSELFDDCKRAYYYNYYKSHNGWKDNAMPDVRGAYTYKNAISLKTIFSLGVQRAIATYFNSKPGVMTKEQFASVVTGKLHAVCANARDRVACLDDPKRLPLIVELENYEDGYKNAVVKKTINEIKAQVSSVTDNFYSSSTVADILAGAKLVEKFENFSFGYFSIPGKSADFTIWGKADTIHVIDKKKFVATVWKSKEKITKNEELHAKAIAMYVQKRYKVEFANIEVRFIDLINGESKSYSVKDQADYTTTVRKIGASIGQMIEFVEDKNIVANKALPMEKFPLKGTGDCQSCKFYALCKAERGTTDTPQVA